MTDRDLEQEVRRVLEHHRKQRQAIPKSWLIQAVLLAHPTTSEWWHHCGYVAVGQAVRRVIGDIKAHEDNGDPQMVLPGYERLQESYLVTRDGEQVIVCVDELTDTEWDQKEAEYERNIGGLTLHLQEIRRFRADKAARNSASQMAEQ